MDAEMQARALPDEASPRAIPVGSVPLGLVREIEGEVPRHDRPKVRGKFLFIGDRKLYVRGVTYGAFRPDEQGNEYSDLDVIDRDFEQMAANGINAVRIPHTTPPRALLDIAHRRGLYVMVGLSAESYVGYLADRASLRDIERRIEERVRRISGHPALLCYALGNEIPASLARWIGKKRVERYLRRLYSVVKEHDPDSIVTYVNYPSTEYLELPFLDLVSFNVYLEDEERLRAYLARLQNVAGDRPLLLTELGLDALRNGEVDQAKTLRWQISTTFSMGGAGAFVFAWTDEWFRANQDVEDWAFGLTRRDRSPKPALATVRDAYAGVPLGRDVRWPTVSVVVCTYNGASTIHQCLDALAALDYPDYEVIVVDDGSTDPTTDVVAKFVGRHNFRIIKTENRGLSSARNTGLEVATGEIVAYIDDDAFPDAHWLQYLASTFLRTSHAGVGGPNIPPGSDGAVAECVANSPGGPIHVLLTDEIAEHIPGCNMAFRKQALEGIGGFDPRFHTAGDDVDVCWRLQERGWTLGFNHGAMVWHRRRNSLRTYWSQQRGYGRAEALLEAKWPDRYNGAGHLTWAGRVYNGHRPGRRGRLYHGVWGSAPFQRLYETPTGRLASLPALPEWQLLVLVLAVVTLLGATWHPLLLIAPLLGAALCATIVGAVVAGMRMRFASTPSVPGRFGRRTLTAALHLVQPVARLWGRLRHGLTPWRRRGGAGLGLPIPRTTSIWSERWAPPIDRVRDIADRFRQLGASVRHGGEFDRWDLEAGAGALASVRMRMAVEDHGAGHQFLRFRHWPRLSNWAIGIGTSLIGVAVIAGFNHEILPAAVLGMMAALLVAHLIGACSAATAVIRQAIRHLETVEKGLQ